MKIIQIAILITALLFLGLSLALQAQLGPGSVTRGAAGTVFKPAKETAGGGAGLMRTDDFGRADNADLGSNWTPITGEDNFEVSATTAIPDVLSSDAGEFWSADSWTANQSSAVEVTVNETVAGLGGGVAVRVASAADTFYRVVINSDGDWEMGRVVAGVYSGALASGTVTYVAGAILKLTATGTGATVTLITHYNGSQINSFGDTDANRILSGSPGIFYSSATTSCSLDDWEGKDGL